MTRSHYKNLSKDDCFRSFTNYKYNVDREYKDGKLTREEASRLLSSARKNYQRQNYNRMVDRLNAT